MAGGPTVTVVTLVTGTTVVTVAVGSADVMKHLQAELMRVGGTVAKYVGMATSRRSIWRLCFAAAALQAACTPKPSAISHLGNMPTFINDVHVGGEGDIRTGALSAQSLS